MTWPKFSRFRKEQNQWDNPEASTGIFIRFIGKNVCHEATGPARKIFDQQLGKEIKAILDGCGNPLQQTVTWSIYMIGRTRETSAPKVIFSCTDEAARACRHSCPRHVKPARSATKCRSASSINSVSYPARGGLWPEGFR